ncbi:MAG TPA: preprotein translocase subunit SecG [Desulfobacteria bacterium]|nr:preprotein translocase subunit SecG [Desulfobacteria bacterium]
MFPVLIVLHVCVCVALILIVLLQKGKGAGMGAAFGGSSQTVFGSTGATSLLHKVTTAVAIVFMLTSLGLTIYIGKGTNTSVMKDVQPVEQTSEAPAATPPASGGTQDTK